MKYTPLTVFCLLFLASFSAFSEPGPYLRFMENKNQWPAYIDFATRVPGGNMAISPGRFSYALLDFAKMEELHERGHQQHKGLPEIIFTSEPDDVINGHVVNVNFVGANRESKAQPFGMLSTYYNFFIGKDSSSWASDVHAFEGLIYPSFYEGIDLKVYSQGQSMKYDFIVAPGADPSQILAAYEGARKLYLDRGDLIIHTSLGDLIEKDPVAYQIIEGKKILIKCEFKLVGKQMSFFFPEGYDSCHELVIDPILIFSTFSGSTADNWGSTATPGEKGKLYSGGAANNSVAGGTFPATAGSFQTVYAGIYDVGILKYDSLGQQLLYASYLGGSNNESVHSLVMNSNQELVVLGTTSSNDFPTTLGVEDNSFNGGIAMGHVYPTNNTGSDIFVARISGDGRQLLASTYLGGGLNDGWNPTPATLPVAAGQLTRNYGDQLRGDIITDNNGNIYISSVTASADFPVRNSFNINYNGGATDALILKLDAALTIQWGAFLGGLGADAAYSIKFDKTGDLYIGGGTSSNDFPVTPINVYQSNFGGDVDGWIAKISRDGMALLIATYTGTAAYDQAYFIDLGQNDDVFVYGQTAGAFPVTPGTYSNANGKQFLQRFDKDLKNLKFSTVFGSGRAAPDISPTAFLVNDCNNIFMTGWGGGANFNGGNTLGMVTTVDAFQRTTLGSDFYFIVLTADGSELLYATYMGGRNSATHVDGGTSRFDKSGVVYHAVCGGCGGLSDFPTTPGVVSITNRSNNCNNAAFKFDLSSLKARFQTNSVALNTPGLDRACAPSGKIVFQNRSLGGKIFEWDFGDNVTMRVNNTQDITHEYTTGGNYQVRLKAIDVGTCQAEDVATTQIHVYSPLGAVGPGGLYCQGSSFQLSASGGVLYEWVGLNDGLKSNAPTLSVTPTKASYEVTITDFQGCTMKGLVDVEMIPAIDLKFKWEQTFGCDTRPVLTVKDQTNEKEDTFWDFGDGTVSDLRDDQHAYENDGLYTVRLVGRKQFCVYEKKVTVPTFTSFVPNVITPDQSPGLNDTFQVLYGGTKPEEKDMTVSLIVYNRWGDKVFESSDYKNDWAGNGLANGLYYYEATFKDETTCRSWLQIVR
jgi:CHU_C Type IX secretion signal domain/PKD domain